MKRKLSHVDRSGNPTMVHVGGKAMTARTASAQAKVWLGPVIMSQLTGDELMLRKGPVFQTAILAGIMGAKKTSELIPLCHPIGLDDCTVTITVEGEYAVINTTASLESKTGVEMEALTAAAVAALTIYDMCKAMSHDIRIESIQLMSKRGGKHSFARKK
jgi:cyclic pyranopterin monophosphate synthase